MPDNPTCPWCGAEAIRWSLLVDRGEWLCGSHKSGKEPWQSVECRNNVLEAENERLNTCLSHIVILGHDYDGYESAADLKGLIDEMVELARSRKPLPIEGEGDAK